jgi:hypothetical protein
MPKITQGSKEKDDGARDSIHSSIPLVIHSYTFIPPSLYSFIHSYTFIHPSLQSFIRSYTLYSAIPPGISYTLYPSIPPVIHSFGTHFVHLSLPVIHSYTFIHPYLQWFIPTHFIHPSLPVIHSSIHPAIHTSHAFIHPSLHSFISFIHYVPCTR